jgi:hypothetical protein
MKIKIKTLNETRIIETLETNTPTLLENENMRYLMKSKKAISLDEGEMLNEIAEIELLRSLFKNDEIFAESIIEYTLIFQKTFPDLKVLNELMFFYDEKDFIEKIINELISIFKREEHLITPYDNNDMEIIRLIKELNFINLNIIFEDEKIIKNILKANPGFYKNLNMVSDIKENITNYMITDVLETNKIQQKALLLLDKNKKENIIIKRY